MSCHPYLSLVFAALFTAGGCAAVSDTPSVQIKGKTYVVEVSDTDALRERGLMFRKELAADAGMLFVHPGEDMLAYWMKNTYIPLDILYFDAQLHLVSAQLDVVPCGNQPRCPAYPSAAPAKYVLELNAGQAKAMGLAIGDMLTLHGIAPEPAE